MRNTDAAWERHGATDPYHSVLTSSRFDTAAMDEAARAEFFESGQRYIGHVIDVVHDRFDPDFRPTRALDFVGRLTTALARWSDEVVGVDISPSMLAEARANCERLGITNATFHRSDDHLTALNEPFDFLNSSIVFQHIPPKRGEAVVRRMVGPLLAEGGIGALQFTYAFESATPPLRRALTKAYWSVPGVWQLRNLVKREPLNAPKMEMNAYDIGRLLVILQENDCHSVSLRFTEAGVFGYRLYGVILLFRKQRLDVGVFS
jgi:SAM-dependent methyltransferase